jgi:hypothetical protein
MNYQRTKKGFSPGTKIAAAVTVAIIVFRLFAPHAFAGFFTATFSPLWRLGQFAFGFSSTENTIVFSPDSPFASSSIAYLLEENMELKNLLGRPQASSSVLAVILKRPPFSAYDSFIVDRGSDEGIQVGDQVYAVVDVPVYNPIISTSTLMSTSTPASTTARVAPVGNPQIEIPIGQVAEVYGGTSVVSLFSSPGATYPVEIGSSHISATATADGAGMFEAMLPTDTQAVIGDPVFIPNIQSSVFGSVAEVISDPARPYALVLFKSPINPFALHFVEIEKNHATK